MHGNSPPPSARRLGSRRLGSRRLGSRRLGSRRLGFCSLLCCLLLCAATLTAEEPAAEDVAARSEETVYSLFVKGGTLMYPILLCSIIVVTLAIERAISMRRKRIGTTALLEEVTDVLPSRKKAAPDAVRKAIQTATTGATLVGQLLEHGLVRLHRDEEHVQTALEESAAKEMHRLHRRLRPFAVIATLAPLLGLLGTVIGMILCFGEASVAEATERAQKLSDGIYRALVTTAAGLCVAIPSMLLSHFYLGRVDGVIDLLDETATRFLDHYYGDLGSAAVEQNERTIQDEPIVRDEDGGAPGHVDLPRSAAAR